MNWNEIMAKELANAGAGASLTPVPEHRRASAVSLLNLERYIGSQISENEAMSVRSRSYAASMPVKKAHV